MSSDLASRPQPSAPTILEQCASLVTEAMSLRDVEYPPESAGPQEWDDQLTVLRPSIDRVEAIYNSLVQLRGRARRTLENAKNAHQDAWDVASRDARQSGVQRGSQFMGPREQYADYNLATLTEARAMRAANYNLSVVEESLEVVRTLKQGLNGLREDANSHSRNLQFLSSLGR